MDNITLTPEEMAAYEAAYDQFELTHAATEPKEPDSNEYTFIEGELNEAYIAAWEAYNLAYIAWVIKGINDAPNTANFKTPEQP